MNPENEILDLKELFHLLKRNMFFIIIVSILFGTLAGFYSEYMIDKKYKSETTIYIKPIYTGTDNSINYNDILVTHNLVKTYSVIAKSDRVLSRVVGELNLNKEYNMTEKSVRNIVSINSVNDTEVISISVIYNDPEISAIISNKIGEVFMEEIPKIMIEEKEELDELNDGVKANITLSLIDEAKANYFPVSPNIKLNITIGLILGIMGSVGIILLRSYFDKTIRTPKDVEKYFDLPIIGMIPDHTSFIKNTRNGNHA